MKTGKQNINEMAYPSSFNMDEFKAIPSFSKRVQYCKQRLTKLGEGSSRMVFQVDDSKVIKIAKNKKGVAQNEVESDMGYNQYYFTCIAEVFEYDDKYLFVEMELADKCTPGKFKRITGYDFKTFVNFIRAERSHTLKKEFSDEFIDTAYDDGAIMVDIIEFVHNYDLPLGDVYRLANYGVVTRNGQEFVVLVDYGLNDDVWKNFYSRRS